MAALGNQYQPDPYEMYAVRYATVARRGSENFIEGIAVRLAARPETAGPNVAR